MDVSFVGDRMMRSLNRSYHNCDCPTDVLAFDYGDKFADIIISLDTARRNSKTYKTSFKNEILLYLIHGILHLAGYNDANTKDRKRMYDKQEEIFESVKLKAKSEKLKAKSEKLKAKS